jgi:hypothetical protein
MAALASFNGGGGLEPLMTPRKSRWAAGPAPRTGTGQDAVRIPIMGGACPPRLSCRGWACPSCCCRW